MKNVSKILLMLFGLTTLSTIAQTADSVIVIYDNQKTIIPVPGFGKQTAIKMTDSVQIIEIGVSRRKSNDHSMQLTYASNNPEGDKPSTKTKWFSQIEAGYITQFVSDERYQDFNEYSQGAANIYINTENFNGYRIALSVNEKEKYSNNKFSYVYGFKFGFAQAFRKSSPLPIVNDTLIHVFYGYSQSSISNIQFLFPIEFRYHFKLGKSPAQIKIGTNIGTSLQYFTNEESLIEGKYQGAAILLQPYVGLEKGKVGILLSTDLYFSSFKGYIPEYSFLKNNIETNIGIGISLTYRFF